MTQSDPTQPVSSAASSTASDPRQGAGSQPNAGGRPGTRLRLKVLLTDEVVGGPEGWHETVSRLLAPQGVQTVVARSGKEALDSIEHDRIHLAVLDERMPQLGGLQVVRLLRGSPHVPPTILLANRPGSRLMREAVGMSVFSVLSKPVDLDLLLDAMARVLRRHYEGRWPE